MKKGEKRTTPVPIEVRQRISNTLKGRIIPTDVRARMSAASRGVPKLNLRGKKLNEAHRKAISDGNKGRIFSEETKRKISQALTGIVRPPRAESVKSQISSTMLSNLAGHKNLCHARRICQRGNHEVFRNLLEPLGYISEFMIGPYAADFANPSNGFAIEVDGPEHELSPQVKRDAERDSYYKSKGWRVIRVRDWLAKKSRKRKGYV